MSTHPRAPQAARQPMSIDLDAWLTLSYLTADDVVRAAFEQQARTRDEEKETD